MEFSYCDSKTISNFSHHLKELVKRLKTARENHSNQNKKEHQLIQWSKQAIFIFVYYAGHGTVMDGTTQIVLNINEGKKTPYPIETQLRLLGRVKGVYVMGVLDCCRSPITPK